MSDKVKMTERAYLLAQARGQALAARLALREAAINAQVALGDEAPPAKRVAAALRAVDVAWTALGEALDFEPDGEEEVGGRSAP